MTKMKMKLQRTAGGDIRATVFLGPKGQTLQNAGRLILQIGECQLVTAALMMGAKHTAGQLIFEIEGEKEALTNV